MRRKADPYTMHQERVNPPVEKYMNGDPSAWAEDLHPIPPYGTPRNQIGLPEFMETTWTHKGTEDWSENSQAYDNGFTFDREDDQARRLQSSHQRRVIAKLEVKASKCIRIAKALLVNASADVIEEQAMAFMSLSDRAIQATLVRLAEDEHASEEEEEEEDEVESRRLARYLQAKRKAKKKAEEEVESKKSKKSKSKKADEDDDEDEDDYEDDDDDDDSEEEDEVEAKKSKRSRKSEEEDEVEAKKSKRSRKSEEEDEVEAKKSKRSRKSEEEDEVEAKKSKKRSKKAMSEEEMDAEVEAMLASMDEDLDDIVSEEDVDSEEEDEDLDASLEDLLDDEDAMMDDMVDDSTIDDMVLEHEVDPLMEMTLDDDIYSRLMSRSAKGKTSAQKSAQKGVKRLGRVTTASVKDNSEVNDLSKLWTTEPDVSKVFKR
jgi:hypothetical protein